MNSKDASPEQAEHLLEHEYDGIREYDNPTPGWWTAIFVVSCIWAVGYLIYYHWGGPGLSETELYDEEVAAYNETMVAVAATAPTIDEATLAKMSADPAVVSAGKAVFATHCASCHTPEGKGLVGPNLTDGHQIHGSSRMDIYKTIQVGVPAKGMIAWEPVLSAEDMGNVAVFVSTLRHTNVANGKAPEGEEVAPFSQ